MTTVSPLLTVSIVSHGQSSILRPLLQQLAGLAAQVPMRVLVTLNLPCDTLRHDCFLPLDLEYIENSCPKGFGANHNAAFSLCRTPFFCVVNPDVRIEDEPFSALLDYLRLYPGVAGPIVRAPNGAIEDSARRVPSPGQLFQRVVLRGRNPDYLADRTRQVDWLAGMFMIFDSGVYRQLGGFDDSYFLYCEDVDICLRLRLAGYSVSWVANATIIHDARRASRRKARFLIWHLSSMARLLSSGVYRRFRRQFANQVYQP